MRHDEHQDRSELCDNSERCNLPLSGPGEPVVDINLCCGVGGLALGLGQAGFRSFDFFDKDAKACATLQHNIATGSCMIDGRVFECDLSLMEWLTAGTDIRLLAAGAPCQPFSIGGSRRGHDDNRNLFPTLLKVIKTLRPRAVLIENVRGLERGSHKPYLDYLLKQLRYPEIGPRGDESWADHEDRLSRHEHCSDATATYRVMWRVLNSADYGVPQVRHRLFIVATSAELPEYDFPEPTHSKQSLIWHQSDRDYWERRNLPAQKHDTRNKSSIDGAPSTRPWVTVRDAIADLPPAHSEERGASDNHWSIPGARTYAGHTGSSLDWPSKTIKAGTHGVPGGENTVACDNGQVRYYTLREMARVQSFPDEHYFVGSRSNVIRQIGNAVPPTLAAAVASPLANILFTADCPTTPETEIQGPHVPYGD